MQDTSLYLTIKYGTLSELSLIDGRTQREVTPPQSGAYVRPHLDGNSLFLSCGNSNVCSFDLETLRLRWSTYVYPPHARTGSVHPEYELSPPAADSSGVYFTSSDGSLYCLERQSGRLRWKHRLGAVTPAMPLLLNGVLYAAGFDSAMTAIEPATGERRWRIELGESVEFCAPRAVGSLIYCAGRGGSVFCVDSGTGKIRWRRRVGEQFRGQVSASRNLICAADRSGIYGLDPQTGRVRWRRAVVGQGPTESRGRIYCFASARDLLVLDVRTGVTLASYPIGESGFFPQPVVVGKRILAVGRGWIYCFADIGD